MASSKIESLTKLASNRGSMYTFLSRSFRLEVDKKFLDRMIEMPLAPKTGQQELTEGYQMLKSFLDHRSDQTLADLAVDYAALFLGAGATQNAAYPYESVYTSPSRLVMQDARDQVLRLYKENGLVRAEGFVEPEDHLSFELELMAYLCQKTVAALQAHDTPSASDYLLKQEEMLKEHLANWVPSFTRDVQRLAINIFYPAIAKMTNGFLVMEQYVIEEMMKELIE